MSIPNLLLTDLYQLTMAYGYFKLNMHERQAVFHLIFRKNPFKSPYAICAGLSNAIEFLNHFRFTQEDLDYLATLQNAKHNPLFPDDFLTYLSTLTFNCDVDAIPEGTVVFTHEPLLRIQGPLLQGQLLESPLLNMINFQTLIATKASRVCHAAEGDAVIEFGMRRAQGPDGALSASRAAYIGGCVATSNTLAGKLYDIPVRGTHAHSWVTAFPTEKEAFAAYASIMPHNCILLVDTYDTIQGVKNAIEIGKNLRAQGADLLGIRLDSGDMATLSIKARKLLDEAGFKETEIVASNSLDEYAIADLKQKGAKITVWGAGTNLATAYDHPALDGVYKLSALQDEQGEWQYKLKLSEQAVKVSNPGRHQIRRYLVNEESLMDVIYDLSLGISDLPEAIQLNADVQKHTLDDYDGYVDLLQPIYRRGKLIYDQPSIHTIRKNALAGSAAFYQRSDLHYPVGLEKNLYDLKSRLMKNLKPAKG